MSAAQAVEALIHEYYKLVFHTIYGLTGDWEESQDLTQDTFHQALKAINAARAASGEQFHAKAWLLRILLYRQRMQRRRRNLFRFIPFSRIQGERRERANESEADELSQQAAAAQPAGYGITSSSNEDPAASIGERDAVQRTMARLPEALRTCLFLAVIGRFSTSEIAQILDISEVAVGQRLARARKQFRQFYVLESGEEISDSNTMQVVQTPDVDSDSQQNHVTFLHSHASPLL